MYQVSVFKKCVSSVQCVEQVQYILNPTFLHDEYYWLSPPNTAKHVLLKALCQRDQRFINTTNNVNVTVHTAGRDEDKLKYTVFNSIKGRADTQEHRE